MELLGMIYVAYELHSIWLIDTFINV